MGSGASVGCAAEADYGQAVSIELLKEEAWLKAQA